MSRNTKYEDARKARGLKKKTLWIPANMDSEFEMLANACCEHRHLTFNTLRDTKSGKYVSLENL
ncbi:hypothetical protein F0266_23380 [Vibrio coralliilyticus]|uniref:hypothetical protein n=1 Tax=Vibrio coralliilyticus TaxID=190893 RepID=UPI00148E891B|nr:hypothetical protein [Vibrio coralliilyticus]NOH55871.1 hypothetical protein [Vibrio coralliilyticus]